MNYTHLFFDLDHTLWDFNTNCAHTLAELYEVHRMDRWGLKLEDFTREYMVVNNRMWNDFNQQRITRDEIREKRFVYTFQQLNLDLRLLPPELDRQFLEICPAKGFVFPHTHEVLEYLKSKNYSMHIITNGFKETQHIKLSSSGLMPYFEHVVESELCGYVKPDRRIFEYAMHISGANAAQSLMIGDDLEVDILGARAAGLDQVLVSHHTQAKAPEGVTHQIFSLDQLYQIL